jgi:hypothetical protein
MDLDDIYWHKDILESIIEAQMEINKIILYSKISPENIKKLKELLKKLQTDLENHYISVCDICGIKYNHLKFPNKTEHMSISASWGYESNFDCQNHKLNLCCECYEKHIFANLKEYIKVHRY